jgi:hypothetical protein
MYFFMNSWLVHSISLICQCGLAVALSPKLYVDFLPVTIMQFTGKTISSCLNDWKSMPT